MKIVYKIWLENNGKAFGEGPYQLLRVISKKGSLLQAAKSLGMSYQKAWVIIHRSEERLGFALLERRIGGIAGGGSQLTKAGQRFLEKYGRFRQETEEKLSATFRKYFGRSTPVTPAKIKKK